MEWIEFVEGGEGGGGWGGTFVSVKKMGGAIEGPARVLRPSFLLLL